MNTFHHSVLTSVILSLSVLQGHSQNDTNPLKKEEKEVQKESSEEKLLTEGLKKITTHASRDRNFNIHIDEEALERNIELTIENRMKLLEGALEEGNHIEPIEIDLSKLNVDLDNFKINIPNLDIDIEPIVIDMNDLEVDKEIDHHHFFAGDDGVDLNVEKAMHDEESISLTDQEKDKEKHKGKNKSHSKDKEKSKGLKKLN